MLHIMILICMSAAPSCVCHTAVSCIRPLEAYASEAACLMAGQAMIAGTAIGRGVEAGETIRVVCAPAIRRRMRHE